MLPFNFIQFLGAYHRFRGVQKCSFYFWRLSCNHDKRELCLDTCVHIILYFFFVSLLLYWRMNPWTRACSSISLLFKVTFDHPPSNYRI